MDKKKYSRKLTGESVDKDPGLFREFEVIRSFGIRPKPKFGQNFLLNPRLLDFIVNQADVQPDDFIVEVGPGTGSLTRKLLSRKASVTAIEIDNDLCMLLTETLSDEKNFHLIKGDVLGTGKKLNPELLNAINCEKRKPLKVVSNLPYSCGTPFLLQILECVENLKLIVVTLQIEVVDRFVACPNSSHYGIVSVLSQVSGDVKKVKRIGKSAFWPVPKVDSAVFKFCPYIDERPSPELYKKLKKIVKFSFNQRRKKLFRRIKTKWPTIELHGILSEEMRPESVTPESYLKLASMLKE